MPFQPTDELPIRLLVMEWNQVIAALQEEKQRIANPIINKINQQAMQHEQAQQEAAAQSQPGFANGELKSEDAEVLRTPGVVPHGDLN